MAELLAGALVTAAALVAILEPLFHKTTAPTPASEAALADEMFDLEESDSPRVRALLALKEIEFDRATGKLSDEDYDELKAKYSVAAVAAIRQEEGADAAAGEAAAPGEQNTAPDAAELAVERARANLGKECPTCGPRPEGAAVFCSSCGRSLKDSDSAARCWLCGANLPTDAKFCSGCGGKVAA